MPRLRKPEKSHMEPTQPLTLVQKLAQIRQEIRHIPKRGENTHFNYKYMRAEDVAGDLGDRLAEVNVILSKRNGTTTLHDTAKGVYITVECEYVFVDGDTKEELVVWSTGTESDAGGKASFKAQTGALKYALTQALCMRVGDDPEDESSDAPERPVARTAAISEGFDTAADATAEASSADLAMLHKLVASKCGSDNWAQDAAWATDWIQRQCKQLWGMTTTSDGKGGARLKDRLQNRHVQELTRRIVEDKDPGDEF